MKRHAFQRVGLTYSLTKSSITAFSTASQTFFQTISFRSGIQGSNALQGIVNSEASFTYTYNTINNPLRPRTGKEYTRGLPVFGYLAAMCATSRRSWLTRASAPCTTSAPPNGHNVLGLRAQLGYIQGFGGDVAPPNNRFYAGGENELRGFDVRGATPYGYVPNRVTVQLTNPDGSCVPRDPTNPQLNQCIQVPLAGLRHRLDRRRHPVDHQRRVPHPHRRPGHVLVLRRLRHRRRAEQGPVEAESRGLRIRSLRPLYGCPVYNNGSCQGGIPGSKVGFLRDIRPVSGTNFVPRMSLGGELSVIMPVVNAPFRLYYAYNPLRLYERPYLQQRDQLGDQPELLGAAHHARPVPARAAQATIPTHEAFRPTARATCSASPARPSG